MTRRGIVASAALVAALAGCSTAASRSPVVGAAPPPPVPSSSTSTVATSATPTSSSSTSIADPARIGASVTRPAVTDDRVFLVGDSITESIGPRYSSAVCHALEPLGWDVTVDAFMGRTTAEAVQSLRTHLSSVGQVVVILIGHNDAVDPANYRVQMTRLLDLVPDVPRVLLLTNYEFEQGRDRMNQVLRDLAAIDPHIQLVDWNLVVRGTKGAIRGDGLHLTSIGEAALSETVAGALGRAPAGDGQTRTCTTFRNSQPSGPSSSGGSRRGNGGSGHPSTTEASSDSSSPAGSTTTAPSSGGSAPSGSPPTGAPPTGAPPTSSAPPHSSPPGTSPAPPNPPST